MLLLAHCGRAGPLPCWFVRRDRKEVALSRPAWTGSSETAWLALAVRAEHPVYAVPPVRPASWRHLAGSLSGHALLLCAVLLLAGQTQEFVSPGGGAIEVVFQAPGSPVAASAPPAAATSFTPAPQSAPTAAPVPPSALPSPAPAPPPPTPAPQTVTPPSKPSPPIQETELALPLPPVPPRLAPPQPRPSPRHLEIIAPSRSAQAPPIPLSDGPTAPSAQASSAASTGPPFVSPQPVAGMEADRPPDYPDLARRRGEQGRVLLRVDVSMDGRPLAVSVARSSGFGLLDSAAEDAVRTWRFVPATQDGRPVPATAEVPVQFRLED